MRFGGEVMSSLCGCNDCVVCESVAKIADGLICTLWVGDIKVDEYQKLLELGCSVDCLGVQVVETVSVTVTKERVPYLGAPPKYDRHKTTENVFGLSYLIRLPSTKKGAISL